MDLGAGEGRVWCSTGKVLLCEADNGDFVKIQEKGVMYRNQKKKMIHIF